MKKILVSLTVFSLIFLMSSSLASCATFEAESEPPVVMLPSSPLKVDLQISQISKLTIEILCEISATDSYVGDVEAEIELPDGLSKVKGELSWNGKLMNHEHAQINAVAKAVKQGVWKITGKTVCTSASGDWVGDIDCVYVSVSEGHIDSISKSPAVYTESKCEKLSSPRKAKTTTQNVDVKQAPVAVDTSGGHIPEDTLGGDVSKKQSFVQPASPGELTITGRFWHWDNNEVQQPLVWATVWIYDKEWWGGLVYLGAALTDTDGYFTFGPINNDDGWLEDGLDIVVCVVAASSAAQVIDGGGTLYDGWTDVFGGCPDGTLDIGDWIVPNGERGAWMIFSYHCGLTYGWNYLANHGPNYIAPQVTCRWPHENWPHYHLGGEIHMPDFDSARSPDVIIHEYGHHVLWNVYGGYWPPNAGGPHQINRHSHPNLAWTEGWANFFPLAVQNDPVLTYVNQWTFNLETPTWGTPNWDDGDDVEGRVTGALWDFFDSTNEDHDVFTDGFLNIWDVVQGQTDDNFAEFWDEWRLRGHNVPYATYAIYQNTITYFGALDHITVSPSSASVYKGSSKTFSAQGYDSDNIPVVGLTYTWSVTGGIGYVSPTSTPDTGGPGQSTTFYSTDTGSGTVRATATHVNTRTGSASVTVYTGGGCPMLYVYDGSEFVYEGLLDIHNPDGIDIVFNHTLTTEPSRRGGKYRFRIIEHSQTHSFIDQVKLYAMLEDGTLVKLPLIRAVHSEDGDVLPQLLFSDDWKTDTLGADHNNGTSQSIDLRFLALPRNIEAISFVFVIEGNNRIVKV